jgi:hypothetical protein
MLDTKGRRKITSRHDQKTGKPSSYELLNGGTGKPLLTHTIVRAGFKFEAWHSNTLSVRTAGP